MHPLRLTMSSVAVGVQGCNRSIRSMRRRLASSSTRPRARNRRRLERIRRGIIALLLSLCLARPAVAESLEDLIPNLFGGTLGTTISQDLVGGAVQDLQLAKRFRDLNASLAAARSQSPIPSASGAFRFAWEPDLDTFVRFEQSLGSGLAERAATLGRGVITVGFSYTHADFDTFEGDDLDSLSSSQPALSSDFLEQLPESDQERFGDDIIETNLDLSLRFDNFYLSAAYGLTDSIDLSLALAINRVRMKGSALAMIVDPLHNGASVFASDQQGAIRNGTGPICMNAFRCAEDRFDETASGTGDIYLRGKWNFANTKYANFAVAGVFTIPTGNADDLLGFSDPTFTPWIISSKTFGRISPHLNVGYAIRSSDDVGQAQWIAGADARVASWLTTAVDFLGYHDDKRDGINDDVIQAAVGLKVNPIRNLVLGGSFQFPINRDGLRADVVYTAQAEYTF
jgi:hypothetical protein